MYLLVYFFEYSEQTRQVLASTSSNTKSCHINSNFSSYATFAADSICNLAAKPFCKMHRWFGVLLAVFIAVLAAIVRN
jgi:hypothetical protein